MENKLLISVLMTAYNRELYIREAIQSILDQTFNNFELIIVDDCSDDRTVEIVKEFQLSDTRIRFYKNSKNIGDYPNRNKAFSYALGEIIVFLDSDDSFNTDALQYIVDSFLIYPESQHSTLYYGKINAPYLMSSEDAIRKHFFSENILSCGPSARVFKRNFYTSMGGYPEKYGPACDMFFNLKTTSNAPILLLPYSYLNYRIHDNQEKNNHYSYIHNGYSYFKDVLALYELPIDTFTRKFLLHKSRVRLLVHICIYFVKTRNLNKSLKLFELTKFSKDDFIETFIFFFVFLFKKQGIVFDNK